MYIRMRSSPAYRFSSTATTEGAVLLLPDGASRKDLLNRKDSFQEYAMHNALRWYQFANQHLGRQIPNGSLILVTGCDMAFKWGIASFSDVSSDVEVELSFIPSYRGTYSWETNIVSATVRTSPGHESISALNRVNSEAVWHQPTAEGVRDLIMASPSGNIDASHGTFNEVRGNQTYNITNNIALATIGDRRKFVKSAHVWIPLTIPAATVAPTPHGAYSKPEIRADERQTPVTGVIAEGMSSVVHPFVC